LYPKKKIHYAYVIMGMICHSLIMFILTFFYHTRNVHVCKQALVKRLKPTSGT